jgi:isoleucyl-tRNA synthetase
LTPELVAEGLARDAVRLIQDLRKDTGCEYTDRIEVGLVTESVELAAAITKYRDYIAGETLADGIIDKPIAGIEPMQAKLMNYDLAIYVRVVK